MEALLVIDIDKGCGWDSDINLFSAEKKAVALAIEETLKKWRDAGGIIIFITYAQGVTRNIAQLNDNMGRIGCVFCDLPDKPYHLAGFLGHRHGTQYEPVFLKDKFDAFTNYKLVSFLRKKGVTKVFLAGCMTSCCVLETALGAVEHGIHVVLLENCTYCAFGDETERKSWISKVAMSATCEKGTEVKVE